MKAKAFYFKGQGTGACMHVQPSAEDVRALLRNPKGLCCDSPLGACQHLHVAFLSAITPSSPTGSAGSRGPSGRVAGAAAWTCCRGLSCSGLHSKLATLGVTRSVGQSNTSHEEYVPLANPKRPPRCSSSLAVGRTRGNS